MPSCLKELAAEYERLLKALDCREGLTPDTPDEALLHILRRLGPPSLTEASEIERREAIARE